MLGADLLLEIKVGRRSFDTSFCQYFDAKPPRPSRMVWLAGLRSRNPRFRNWTIMIQIYRPGFELDWHQDGHGIHNRVWSWVFWKPKRGGEFEIEGPHYTWWRFHSFDGGVSRHRVTRCEGYRGVIMFQRGSKIMKDSTHEKA